MAEEDNLDALCDLLEDSDDEKDKTVGSQLDDSFDEQIFNLVDEEVAKIEAVKPEDNSSSQKNIEKPKDEIPAENENKTHVNKKLRKRIKIMSRAPSVVPSSSSALANSKPVATHVGFKELHSSSINLTNKSANKKLPSNMHVIVEKHSRIRIANPTITQIGLDLRLMGLKMISMNRIRTAVIMKETDSDWTTVGVIFRKDTLKSRNGKIYTNWQMTDLVGDIQTVRVLLFGKANAKHCSMPVNKVIGLLNPKIMDDRNGKGEISLSVDHPDKIMEMGDAIDCGKCGAKRADGKGSGCTNVVNTNTCEFCTFHVQKAYKNLSSKRPSSFSGPYGSRIMSKKSKK